VGVADEVDGFHGGLRVACFVVDTQVPLFSRRRYGDEQRSRPCRPRLNDEGSEQRRSGIV
jgi:hypothetical protein